MIAFATVLPAISKALTAFFQLFVKYPWQILFGIACLVIFLQDSCHHCPEYEPCPEFDTVWLKGDSIPYPDTTYVPQPYPIYYDTGSVVVVEIPTDIDSLEIAKAYFMVWSLQDTILYDTNGIVIINDVISQNRIESRHVEKKFFPSFRLITKTITLTPEPKNTFYLGGGVGGWANQFGVSVQAGLLNKKGRMYIGSYDFLNQYVEVSILFPIRLKRNR